MAYITCFYASIIKCIPVGAHGSTAPDNTRESPMMDITPISPNSSTIALSGMFIFTSLRHLDAVALAPF